MLRPRFLFEEALSLILHARMEAADNGREACGLLVWNGHFIKIVQTRNRVRNGGSFAFYPSDVRRIVRAAEVLNCEVVGTFHSHPAYLAVPSKGDVSGALDDSLLLIVDVMATEMRLWRVKRKEAAPVRFVVVDCAYRRGTAPRVDRPKLTFSLAKNNASFSMSPA